MEDLTLLTEEIKKLTQAKGREYTVLKIIVMIYKGFHYKNNCFTKYENLKLLGILIEVTNKGIITGELVTETDFNYIRIFNSNCAVNKQHLNEEQKKTCRLYTCEDVTLSYLPYDLQVEEAYK
jgi:hypothetical protein